MAYYFSPDHKGEHPRRPLKKSKASCKVRRVSKQSGGLFARRTPTAASRTCIRPGRAAPRSSAKPHLRRDFHDVWKTTQPEIAREAVDRTAYALRHRGTNPRQTRRRTPRHSAGTFLPEGRGFRIWADEQLRHISGKGDRARAFRYALNRWPSFCLVLYDGRVAIDNNPAERAMRPIGIERKSWIFAGTDAGGETLAKALTLTESTKLNGLDPQADLSDVLARIHDHIAPRLAELLAWNWKPLRG